MANRQFRRISRNFKRLFQWSFTRRSWKTRIFLLLLLGSALYALFLDFRVVNFFEGSRWQVPSRVYAAPTELFPGKQLSLDDVRSVLDQLNYSRRLDAKEPGSYSIQGERLLVNLRPFQLAEDELRQQQLILQFDDEILSDIRDEISGEAVDWFQLEPIFIGGIYPRNKEDRVLIQLKDIPPLLSKSLIAVEDQHFYEHWGLVPKSIARALLANIRAGRRVQGGSTLTQQLAKNIFLSNEKSLWRKANEALMALMLEMHYQKDEILEAYLNEVYLGQDGRRAIHGFGLASHFYFGRALNSLHPAEVALLVGLVKGPSYYDPRRYPKRALERRNLVLAEMRDAGLISQAQMSQYQGRGLNVTEKKPAGISEFPAFIDLVKAQLIQYYDDDDLRSQGLRIFSTIDVFAQRQMEKAITSQMARLQRRTNNEVALQMAAVFADSHTGEIKAIAGDKDLRFSGFNRALNASRPIGSLIKPFVYLTALENPARFNLGSLLDDSTAILEGSEWEDWTPSNYDRQLHGQVPMYRALSRSYNLATVDLGMQVGIKKVLANLQAMHVAEQAQAYPSLFLGSVELTPLEVAQIYQVLANNGFYTPLRAIRSVTTAQGQVLSQFPLKSEEIFNADVVYLINMALHNTAKTGTGKSLYRNYMSDREAVAGKTGTTDDKRDSWFAGFDGRKVGAVWLGNDENNPTGLSGSSGALPLWGASMQAMGVQTLELAPPPGVEFVRIDADNGALTPGHCTNTIEIPIIKGYLPSRQNQQCPSRSKVEKVLEDAFKWMQDALKK